MGFRRPASQGDVPTIVDLSRLANGIRILTYTTGNRSLWTSTYITSIRSPRMLCSTSTITTIRSRQVPF